MKILESHHHLWDLNAMEYIWLKQIGRPKPFGDPTKIQKNYLYNDFLSDIKKANGIEFIGSVHIQVDSALSDPVAETSWLSKLKPSGIPSAIIGYVDLTKENSLDIIKKHMTFPKFRGVRQIIAMLEKSPNLSFTNENLLRNDRWGKNFNYLAKNEISFDLQLYPEQMYESADFLSKFPDVPVVIDHAGSPYDLSFSGLKTWKKGLKKLAQLPNLFIKLSGFGMYDKNWSSDSHQKIFDTILEIFNPNHVMWGSNFPVEKLTNSYSYSIEQFLKWLKPLSTEDKNFIAWKTATNFYKIKHNFKLQKMKFLKHQK